MKEACNPKGIRERELLESLERVIPILDLKENDKREDLIDGKEHLIF